MTLKKYTTMRNTVRVIDRQGPLVEPKGTQWAITLKLVAGKGLKKQHVRNICEYALRRKDVYIEMVTRKSRLGGSKPELTRGRSPTEKNNSDD